MKYLLLALLFPVFSMAQSVDVKKIDADTDSDTTTTIQIQKSKNATTTQVVNKAAGPQWEIHDGNADVEGETSATSKEAKDAWKKACKEWTKEFRDDNKENKVLSVNCGTANCSGEAGSKVCTSKASFKIKTRVD